MAVTTISLRKSALSTQKKAFRTSKIAPAAIAAPRRTVTAMIDAFRPNGLTAEAARAKLASDGPNELPHASQRSVWRIAAEVVGPSQMKRWRRRGGGASMLPLVDPHSLEVTKAL